MEMENRSSLHWSPNLVVTSRRTRVQSWQKLQVDACLGVPAGQVGAVLDLWQQGASEERLPLEVIYSQMTW